MSHSENLKVVQDKIETLEAQLKNLYGTLQDLKKQNPEAAVLVAPKKRGRPKKEVAPIPEGTPAPAPKKRGRPKKAVVLVPEGTPAPAPKKRGRPKKVVTLV